MPAGRSVLLTLLVVLVASLCAGCSSSAGSPNDGLPSTDDSGASGRTDAGAPGTDAATGQPDTGSAPTEAGSPPPDGGTGPEEAGPLPDAGPGAAAIEFAPYFPTWTWGASGYAYTSLVDLQKKSGVKEVTIAFVLSNGGCNTTQDIEQNLGDVKAFIAAGGHVKASFGGADGTYVESKCTTAATLATAISDFVDATGITDLDFDIEQDPVLTDTVNAMRGQALKTVQASKNIQVAFTLGANPSPGGGLTSQGMSVVSHAVSAGVKVSHVNLMTMDYGDSFAGQALAPVAIGSLTDANAQLMSIVPGLTKSGAWRMLGVIPMIGENDDSEVFSVADAKTLAAFAVQNELGLVSFWSIDRDQICPKGADYNSCSTVDTTSFQFATVFETVSGP